jgi:hypothetical protein
MNTRLSISILLLFFGIVNAQGENDKDSVLYRQKVIRDDKVFVAPFKIKRGILSLTKDSVIFTTERPENSRFNFSVSYDQIRYIRRPIGFLIPNRIKIKTISGESYRLFTFKKRDIIKITRKQIESIWRSTLEK